MGFPSTVAYKFLISIIFNDFMFIRQNFLVLTLSSFCASAANSKRKLSDHFFAKAIDNHINGIFLRNPARLEIKELFFIHFRCRSFMLDLARLHCPLQCKGMYLQNICLQQASNRIAYNCELLRRLGAILTSPR